MWMFEVVSFRPLKKNVNRMVKEGGTSSSVMKLIIFKETCSVKQIKIYQMGRITTLEIATMEMIYSDTIAMETQPQSHLWSLQMVQLTILPMNQALPLQNLQVIIIGIGVKWKVIHSFEFLFSPLPAASCRPACHIFSWFRRHFL